MKYDTEEIKSFTAYRLANEADCSCPESSESAGATFLMGVRDATIEMLEYKPDVEPAELNYDGAISEIADGAPSCYNFTRWTEFVDLAAWQEDTDELAGDGGDMTDRAGVALYMIAERLAQTLAEQAWTEDEEEVSE